MLPLRRLAVAQAPRLLRTPVAAPSLIRSFHSASLRSFPIPNSTDDATSTSSSNTAGRGPNEAGNRDEKQPHNPDFAKSRPGRADRATTGTGTGTQQNDDVMDANEVKEKVKKTARKAKAAVTNMADDAKDNVQYGADKAKVGYENVKAEVKHTVRKAKTSAKKTARDIDSGYTASSSTADAMGVDTEAIKQKARSAADTAKQTASSVLSSVKQAASSAMGSIKEATAGVTAAASERAGEVKERMAETQENASTRLSNMGERMTQKFEKFGDDLMKSGEEIDRRNREAGEPLPQPLPLDEVDHMPNPKNLDDVLPGTGFKDQQRNTPITDRKGSGQFPG